jgi:hypothetical protein
VSVETDERSGRPSTIKTTENVEQIENSSMKNVTKQSMSSLTPLGSVWSLPGDLNRKSEHVLHYREVLPRLLTSDQKQLRKLES